MRLVRLSFALMVSTVTLLTGLLLYADSEGVLEWQAAVYSVIAGSALLFFVWTHDGRLGNWFLWFSGFFFLLYQFGPLVSLIVIGKDYSVLDVTTTFAASISEASRVESYLLSGLGASFFSVLYQVAPPNSVRRTPNHLPALYWSSILLIMLSSPFVAVDYIWQATTFGGAEYYRKFSSESESLGSPVPLISVWNTINLLGFALWFASVPPERRFWLVGSLYLALSFVASLFGGRIYFVMPIAFLLWYRAYIYKKETLGFASKAVLLSFVFLFVFGMTVYRSAESFPFLLFLAHSISLAQYHLALFIDSAHLLDTAIPYFLAPVLFPVTYLYYGDLAVGQGYESASVRFDLAHVISSRLNIDAYAMGAGLGSSLMAEATQYGLASLFLLLGLHYFIYRWFFNHLNNRLLFLVVPVIFMHVVFSGRDSIFPNTWAILKIWLGAALVYLFLSPFLNRRFAESTAPTFWSREKVSSTQ